MSSFWRKLRWLARHMLVGFLLLLLLVSALLWYVTTDSFQQFVRGRLIATLEHATGGRVELGSFHVVPLRFQVEVRDLTIHGRESSQELPLVHIDSMSAIVSLPSVLGAKIGFRTLTLDHPVVHVIFYPDGTTNRPIPKQTSSIDFAHLLSISIDRLEVHRGELLWQDERMPLEFVSDDVFASLDYSFLRQRYSGNLSVGRAETQFEGMRPVSWSGEAAFLISREQIRVRSLKATAERSHIQASGDISNLQNPKFQGDYDLFLDLRQTAAIARQPGVKSGTMELRGSGSWSGSNFSSIGKFDMKEVSWEDPTFTAKDLFAAGNFSVDPQNVSLSSIQGRFLHGAFTSEAEIHNWHTAAKTSRSAKAETEHGAIKIKAKDFSLSDILAGMGPQFRPYNKLKFSGNVSGASEIRWKGSIRKAEISAALDVSHPGHVLPGEIPLTAGARFTYRAQPSNLEITQLTADTAASQLRASGDLSSAMNVSFASSDLREWQPILTALFPGGMPLTIHGRAAFKGTANGNLPNVVLAGNLQVGDFDVMLPAKGSSVPVHWDSLNADLQMSPRVLNIREALLESGDTSLRLSGNAGLTSWKVAMHAPMRLHVDAQDLDAALLKPFLKKTIELSGEVSGHADVSGTPLRPQGQGNFTWSNGSIDGNSFDAASASFNVDGTRFGFKDLKATQGQGQITGNGSYDLAADSFQLKVTGANFNLGRILPPERSRIKVGGRVDFTADASGTQAKPTVTAHFHLRGVTLNDEEAGDYLLDANTQGSDLQLTGRSDFKGAELSIAGTVHLRDLWPARINFHFTRLDIDSFLESYLHGHLTGHSAVAGDLVLEGPLRDPLHLNLLGNLTDFSASIEKVKLQNQGPLQFSVSSETLKIDSLHIVGDSTDFSAHGTMQLSGERAVNFTGAGKIGLQLVSTYDPDFTGSGTLSGEAQVTGTVSAPLVKGKLQIENGAIADINLPSALSDMNGSFAFNQNQITIESLTGHTGGGTVNFSGNAQLVGGQVNFDLTANANEVRLRYPPGVSSTADATLRWNGSTAGSLLSGDITVNKLGVTPGFDFGAYMERTLRASSLPQTDPVLNKIRLDLHVVTAPELQMQTSVLRLRGEADLRVRGNAAKPVLLGRADVFEGEAYFNGTKYRLERGGVTFGAPAASNAAASVPFVDLEATTRVRDYDITLSINGPADRPKLSYRSEPPLPTNDIIGLLAFGQTTEESAQLQQANQSAFSQQASNAMLAAALNATLNNRTQRLFGNSRIKIDPQGLATETSPTQTGPAVTIEQQVKDNLTITYTTDVAQTSQQIIRAEYNVSRNISVVAIRDQNGVVSFDVKIRRRKR